MNHNFTEERSVQRIKNTIKHIWHQLTDDEIDACEERRDVFFLAVRKKHGLERAQAELILNDLKRSLREAA
jgi:hypothetical protein